LSRRRAGFGLRTTLIAREPFFFGVCGEVVEEVAARKKKIRYKKKVLNDKNIPDEDVNKDEPEDDTFGLVVNEIPSLETAADTVSNPNNLPQRVVSRRKSC
jgi:MFS superfamily sulfate permease-like transporter